MAGNTLTGLIPTIYTALDSVSREQVGFIPAVARNSKAETAALDQNITAPVAPIAKTVDIVPGPTAAGSAEQTLSTVEVKISKSKMAPVQWNGEEQLAVGKAGSTPFGVKEDLADFADARRVLEDNGAPTTDLQMVLGSAAISNIRGKQSVLFKVNEAGSEALLREGTIGRIEGFNLHNSAGIKRVTAGTGSGFLVNKAGGYHVGNQLIAVDSGSGTINRGDIVTFTGDTHQYVVAAASASTITLSAPGLLQDLADNTAVTLVGHYTANMAFDRNAFLLASRTPAMPQGGDIADDVMNVTDPVSGMTFQVALYRQYHQIRYEVGLAWGVAAVKPEHSALILG
ncbi:P22 phage major capsid protein family protein [Candidatus Fukatsuia endosymbiont of Tuberolachnus salignus]|uniref:P22 phage major capsid protein family protein n=1 Tax=Candidatus Fukatsuia endosymbiont of Tuberolachnus salignus TaxID=3077957 RepID=UPI00313B65A7